MSRVRKIELFFVEIPLPEPLFPAWYRGYKQDKQIMTLARLTTADGYQGISAGWSWGREREGLKDWLPSAFLGVDADAIDVAHQRLKEQARWGWNNWWLEAAFWDIRAQKAGIPLYQLWMDERKTVDAVNVYAGTQEIHGVEHHLRTWEIVQKRGIQAMCVRLSSRWEDDLRLLQQLRKEAGDDLLLMLDVGQSNRAWVGEHQVTKWHLSEALDFAAAIESLRVEWLENPLGLHAYGDLSVLRGESTIPVAGGRLNQGWHEYKVLIDQGSLDMYRPDVTVCGVSSSLQLMDACLRRDLYFAPHCGMNSISLVLNLHMYAACPRKFLFEFPVEPGKWEPEIRDVLFQEPLHLHSNGQLPVPQLPGLGVKLNEKALQQYGTRWLSIEA